jgi:deoxyribonuclease-4
MTGSAAPSPGPAAPSPGSVDEPARALGPHLPLGGGLLKAADRAREIGATAIQVFTDNPTAWRRRTAPPPELEAFRARLAEYGIGPLAIHAPYLINLCGGNPDFWERSIATLANELRVGREYAARFVVFHIGSHGGFGREQGIQRLADGLVRVLADSPADGPLLVLENAAGMGDGIGASLEDLADILDAAARADVPLDRLGLCLDTAHLWAAGIPIDSPSGIDAMSARIDELVGRDKVVMLHLNDSRTSCGSRADRHEHIGAGQIGPEGLRGFLNDPWLRSLPTYLETPGMDLGYDAVNLERARLLLEDAVLPELPPEAFAMRSSRARTPPPARQD